MHVIAWSKYAAFVHRGRQNEQKKSPLVALIG